MFYFSQKGRIVFKAKILTYICKNGIIEERGEIMAKFCKVCGVEYHNSALKCVMCKTAFNDAHIYARRRRLIILAICITLLIASVIALVAYSFTPQAAVRRIMNAYKRNDVDTVVSYYPNFYLESDKVNKRKLLLDAEVETTIYFEQLYTFYLEDPMTPSEKECQELIATFKHYGGENFDENKLGEIKMVWVNYTLDIPKMWPKGSTRFIVFEYEERWCWWPHNVTR